MPDRLGSPPTRLEVQLQHALPSLTLNVHFTADAAWTVLFGPSGSGKTTLLRAIAGLFQPSGGHIMLRRPPAEPLVCLDSTHQVALPAHRRPFRMATQSAALFPRTTVLQNVRYGTGTAPQLADEVLHLLQLSSLIHTPVERLSGGEAQRVAVARAVAAARAAGDGTWLLLDEPFTGLDLRTRRELAGTLRSWLAACGHPVLSVTHDVAEVFSLNAEVVRLEFGQVAAQGPPETVLAAERANILEELRGRTVPQATDSPGP